jgi:hypothetical protein
MCHLSTFHLKRWSVDELIAAGVPRDSSITKKPWTQSSLPEATRSSGFQLAPKCALQETVVAGEEGGDMRFLLPGGPSPAALAALLSACRELDRAGAPCMLEFVMLAAHLSGRWLPRCTERRELSSVLNSCWWCVGASDQAAA